MGFELAWMRPDAPYMPIATIGLLAVLERARLDARAYWADGLRLDVDADVDRVAELLADARFPNVAAIGWPTQRPQALGPSLAKADDPPAAYQALVAAADRDERLLLHAVATDQVLDKRRVPGRTRLLRGAKSDLSPFIDVGRVDANRLADELTLGPQFESGKSGRALGLVPEVQTFGGSVGREASSIGAESRLLSLLLRHGILALPPVGVARGSSPIVGGPLLAERDRSLSWPRWSMPCGIRELRAVFCMAEAHAVEPDPSRLRPRGIEAVYRSRSQHLSTTVAVFRWGTRIA